METPSKNRPETMTSSEEQVSWIDEQDQVIQVLPRSEIRARNLLHRVTATLVFHPDGRLFVHQRTHSKDVYPGRFDLMVGGTVVAGEDYPANACREIAEELGVRGVPLYHLLQYRHQDEYSNSLVQLFACWYDGEIILQPEEVADGFWATEVQVQEVVAGGQLCPDSALGWQCFVQQYGTVDGLRRAIDDGLPAIDCGPWVV